MIWWIPIQYVSPFPAEQLSLNTIGCWISLQSLELVSITNLMQINKEKKKITYINQSLFSIACAYFKWKQLMILESCSFKPGY